jgi:hypothetical protein
VPGGTFCAYISNSPFIVNIHSPWGWRRNFPWQMAQAELDRAVEQHLRKGLQKRTVA